MISLELCEISLIFEKSRPQLQNSSYQRALSHKKNIIFEAVFINRVFNFKNVGL